MGGSSSTVACRTEAKEQRADRLVDPTQERSVAWKAALTDTLLLPFHMSDKFELVAKRPGRLRSG